MINVPICILIIIHWLHTVFSFNIDVSIIFINDRLFHLNEFALICLKKTSYKKQKCCWCLHILLLLWIIHLSLWLGISNSLKKDLPKKNVFFIPSLIKKTKQYQYYSPSDGTAISSHQALCSDLHTTTHIVNTLHEYMNTIFHTVESAMHAELNFAMLTTFWIRPNCWKAQNTAQLENRRGGAAAATAADAGTHKKPWALQ